MKERPIIFNGEMVRAILDGRKTQTRRVMIPQVGNTQLKTLVNNDGDLEIRYLDPSKPDGVRWEVFVKGKYGKPGDRLWVRETFMPRALGLNISEVMTPHYKADPCGSRPEWAGLWKPSIHMPRKFSRITLEIESVRVERVQEITPNDCRAEGIGDEFNDIGARYCFGQLWNEINEAKGFGWEPNPWVWAITFRRVK